MTKSNSSTLLAERLGTLLAERKALRPLLARYRVFLHTRHFNDERTDLEQKISAVVSDGLPFDEKERRYHLPQASSLAASTFALRTGFNQPHLQDRPALIWDGSPVPGITTVGWHQAVKQRLIDLCGPLDETLARMLSA